MKSEEQILFIMEKLIHYLEDLIQKDPGDAVSEYLTSFSYEDIDVIEAHYKEAAFQKKYSPCIAEIESTKASAHSIRDYISKDIGYTYKKIEFELLPLLENLRLNYYYFNFIEGNKEREELFHENQLDYYYNNRYLKRAEKEGEYKYELSIAVTGYNKLEVTKKCVESLLKYLPKNISYELILVNHGSTDGTKEYFESICPHKQIDIKVNGGASTVCHRILEGRYFLAISNDILVTHNSIVNLYKCISSSEKIGWVVPTTPNISNYQTIPTSFTTTEEMYIFAEKNNVSNSLRWEEKPRLVNPIDIIRVKDWFNIIIKNSYRIGGNAFPDDYVSMLFRRAGYKLILAKEAYCYHFGSVTIRDEIPNYDIGNITYIKGRIRFLKQNGIDPWGYGFCYDMSLASVVDLNNIQGGNILGINSGMGANLLKIGSIIKEFSGIKNIKKTFVSQYRMNEEDLKNLGDKYYFVNSWTSVNSVVDEKYDAILLENGIEESQIERVKDLYDLLNKNGVLYLRIEDNKVKKKIIERLNTKVIFFNPENEWVGVQKKK